METCVDTNEESLNSVLELDQPLPTVKYLKSDKTKTIKDSNSVALLQKLSSLDDARSLANLLL